MAIVGRTSGSNVEQLAAIFSTDITSADVGRPVYFNGSAFTLLDSLDEVTLTNHLVGIISAVTVNGNGLGGLGAGYVTLRGTIQKSGAVMGQAYFAGLSADVVSVPPINSPAIRVGFSRINNFLYVDMDPNGIQIALLAFRMNAVEARLDEIWELVRVQPVYDFGANDNWAINPENTNTDFSLDNNWTEGSVEYNANFGLDDDWGTLVDE